MSHYPYEKWQAYISDMLDECERTHLENHLYSCDSCLEIYLEIVEKAPIPVLNNENITDQIINEISHEFEKQEEIEAVGMIPFYKKALFQYAVAAIATLIFMFSGLFNEMSSYVSSAQERTWQEKKAPVSEGIMNKTLSFLDSIQWEDDTRNE